jgi:NADH-quinone oxidoreductase subunit M
MPLVRFHTWLPDAHTEAPTAGSVLLAGLFLKAGAYGFARIALPYFPHAVAYFREAIFIIAVVGVIYGALVSIAQKDLKRLIAYSSVSHMGFVMLGLIALNHEGVMGAFLQMFNHGVTTGALFMLFGILYARSHTREIAELGGVAKSMRIFAALFILSGLSSLGLPGLNNFIGEILILFGAARTHLALAATSAVCIVFAAIYILWAVQRVFFGKEKAAYKDIKIRELAAVVPLVVIMIWLGVYPKTILGKVGASATNMITLAKRAVVEEPRESLNIIVPEIRKRMPNFIMPVVPENEMSKPMIDEITGGSPVGEGSTTDDLNSQVNTEQALPQLDEPASSPGENNNTFYPSETPAEQTGNE